MSKWPKGLAKRFNERVRGALLPSLSQHGFAEFPVGGGDGKFSGGTYFTDLFRARGSDIDIVGNCIGADGFHPLSASIEAVRASGNIDVDAPIPSTTAFPFDVRFSLTARVTWRNFLAPVFELGPPWPVDADTGIGELTDRMVARLPVLANFLETGKVRYLFGVKSYPRVPLPNHSRKEVRTTES